MPNRGRGKWSRRLRKQDKLTEKYSERPTARRASERPRLGFETLEERQLLAVQPFPVPLDPMQPFRRWSIAAR